MGGDRLVTAAHLGVRLRAISDEKTSQLPLYLHDRRHVVITHDIHTNAMSSLEITCFDGFGA